MLSVNILHKKRGNKMIVRDITFSVNNGENVMILGTSGAGKSTIIKCIIKETLFKGRVTVDGKKIAYIAQHPALNDRETVFEAIYYACLYDNSATTERVASKMAEEVIDMLGLSYIKSNRVGQISGGQRQRVAIATEIVRKSEILIFDEPDSGLDAGCSRKIASRIRQITKKERKISLVISHLVQNCDLYDKLLVLAKDSDNVGGIAFYGSPKDALKYFGVNQYYEILLKINSLEEEGLGLGDYYIKRYRALRKSLEYSILN